MIVAFHFLTRIAIMTAWGKFKPIPVPREALVGSAPPNWNMKHYKQLLSKFQNVNSTWANVKPPFEHATRGQYVVQACFSSFTWFVHQMCTSKLLPWCSYDLKNFLFSCSCDFLAIFFLVFYLKWVQIYVGVCIRGPNIRLLEYKTCSKWFYMIFWDILQFSWVQVRRAFYIHITVTMERFGLYSII